MRTRIRGLLLCLPLWVLFVGIIAQSLGDYMGHRGISPGMAEALTIVGLIVAFVGSLWLVIYGLRLLVEGR